MDSRTPQKRRQGQRPSDAERQHTQARFLESFATMGNVRLAAQRAGISRSTVYTWLEADEQFSLLYHQAEADANDVLRAEIFRRAVQGVDEPLHGPGGAAFERVPLLDKAGNPVLDGRGKPILIPGKPVTVKKYSDTLLIFLSKARMPEFREKTQVEVSGKIDVSGAKELLLERLARHEEAQGRDA